MKSKNENENKNKNKTNNDVLKVIAFKTSKTKVKSRVYHDNHIVPKHCFRSIASGESGSGKTNLIMKLLSEKKFYKDFFHCMFIISPTASVLDDSWKQIIEMKTKTKIHLINELDCDTVEDIMNMNKEHIEEHGVHKAPRILIIYDDVISDTKFLNSKPVIASFIQSRHFNASVMICTQRYNSVPRVCRLQADSLYYFKGKNSERERLADEYCPAGYNKKEFINIIDYATQEPYSFLYVNGKADLKHRYRKNLDTILELQK